MTDSIPLPATQPSAPTRRGYRRVAMTLAALLGLVGLAACDNDVKDVISFAEYVGASAEVLDDNNIELRSDFDCEGSTDTNEVTCTGTSTEGLSIESAGASLGKDSATLVVKVDGEVLYDGLLDDAS
jgi:hypothetical protein